MATPDEMRARWADLEVRWQAATSRAEALGPGGVDERVEGEWSFAETLRHLVYATDAWLRPVLGGSHPFWPAALPHTECPDEEVVAHGIDRRATPAWSAILAARADRQAMVREHLAHLSEEDLARRCAPGSPPPHLDVDSDALTVGECLDVILDEEEAHLGYATRDLAVLEARRGR